MFVIKSQKKTLLVNAWSQKRMFINKNNQKDTTKSPMLADFL